MSSSSSVSKMYIRDELVFTDGEYVKNLILIEQGEVLTFRIIEGRVIPLGIAGPGEFVGESCLFNKEKYDAYAIAIQDCNVRLINKDEIMEVVLNSPEWVRNLTKLMASRLSATEDVISEFKIVDSILTDGLELDTKLEIKLKGIALKSK